MTYYYEIEVMNHHLKSDAGERNLIVGYTKLHLALKAAERWSKTHTVVIHDHREGTQAVIARQ